MSLQSAIEQARAFDSPSVCKGFRSFWVWDIVVLYAVIGTVGACQRSLQSLIRSVTILKHYLFPIAVDTTVKLCRQRTQYRGSGLISRMELDIFLTLKPRAYVGVQRTRRYDGTLEETFGESVTAPL